MKNIFEELKKRGIIGQYTENISNLFNTKIKNPSPMETEKIKPPSTYLSICARFTPVPTAPSTRQIAPFVGQLGSDLHRSFIRRLTPYPTRLTTRLPLLSSSKSLRF